MDPLSITTGIVTLIGVLCAAAERITHLRRGPKDLAELATEIKQLEAIAINLPLSATSTSLSDTHANLLASILTRVETVTRAIEENFPKVHGNGNLLSCFRNASCLRPKFSVAKLRTQVRLISRDLNVAVQMFTVLEIIGLRNQVNELSNHLESHQIASRANVIAQTHRFVAFDWSFERSTSYFPAQFVIEKPLYCRLFIFSTLNLECTPTIRVDKTYLLYSSDDRHWQRVTVIMTTSIGNELAAVSGHRSLAYRMFPGSIQPQVELLLQQVDLAQSITKISVQCEARNDDLSLDISSVNVSEDLEEAHAVDTSGYVTELVHWGLRQCVESEIKIVAREMGFHYVYLASELCLLRKLPFTARTVYDANPIDDFMTEMKTFIAAQGRFGVGAFLSVVLDDQRTQIRGYLIKAPQRGRLGLLQANAILAGASISWVRIRRWIAQLLAITSDLHSHGFVVGYVPHWNADLWVDHNDDIVITNLMTRVVYLPNRRGLMPPEMRKFTKPKSLSLGYNLTIKTDIFNLGHFIWRLAAGIQQYPGMFCKYSGCSAWPCFDDHSNPIALPSLIQQGLPAYIDDIIAGCRQEDPSQRMTASALLELLPTDDDNQGFRKMLSSLTNICPISSDKPPQVMTCCRCGYPANKGYYRCNVCEESDFGLCPNCVDLGFGCYDRSHILNKRILKNGDFVCAMS